MKKQIVCIHWGTKYSPLYVNRLYNMVLRNITPPFRFICFCEDEAGIRPEVECHPLPELNFKLPTNTKGIWLKSRLWNKQLADLTGPFLFLDLDIVITGQLDCFFEYGHDSDVILANNPSNLFERLGQTSVYRAPVGALYPLLKLFATNPQKIADEYKYEQRFVTRHSPNGIKLWPKTWVRHFRRQCRRPFPLNYFIAPRLKRGSRIVIFPGDLGPQDAIEGIYHTGNQAHSRLEHIKAGLLGQRNYGLFPHLRHYILPTPWIENYWR